MIDTTAFLRAVLPPNANYVAVSIKDEVTWQRPAATIEQLLGQTNRWLQAGRDCYFLVAAIIDPSAKDANGTRRKIRAKTNIASLQCLRAELDTGPTKSYDTKDEIVAVVRAAVDKAYLPQPWVVESGGGYHLYWPLVETMPPEQWEALSHRFVNYLRNSCGIAVDDAQCSTDSARVLRVPGTLNYKIPGQPREVALVLEGAAAMPVSRWVYVMDNAGVPKIEEAPKPRRVSEATKQRSDAMRTLDEALSLPVDPNMVFAECLQMRYCRENTATLPEPLWYAALGVATFVSQEMVVAVSEGHADYDLPTALAKAEQWRASATGPTTCARFLSLNPVGCQGCPHATLVSTPVQVGRGLKRVIPIAQAEQSVVPTSPDVSRPGPETPTPEVTRLAASALLLQRGIDMAARLKIRVAADGVWGLRKVDGEDVPIRIWGPTPIVVLAAQQLEGAYNVAIAHSINLETGTYGIKIIRAGALVGNAAVKEWAEAFLIIAHPLVNEYLISWATLLAREPACEMVHRYGFTDDTCTRFVVGDMVYTAEGESVAFVRGDLATTGNLPVYRAGDVGEWIKGAAAYSFEGAEPFACTVLASFASPLVKLVNEHTPAALFIEGSTGRGKTTAVRLAASVWENYQKSEQGGNSSLTGLRLLASKRNSLPMFIDEGRSADVKLARNFLYDLSNGSSRITGTPGQTTISREQFTLITVVTSNAPAGVYFFDASQPTNRNTDEGISARVIPLPVTSATAQAPDKYLPYLTTQSFNRHYGIAGAQYVRFVLANAAEIERQFRTAHQYVRMLFAAAGIAGAGERAAVTVAAIYVAGTITNYIGLTTYDIDRLRGYMVNSFISWIGERQTDYTASVDVIDRFYAQFSRELNTITPSGLSLGRENTLSAIVVYNGHIYFAAGQFERTAAGWGLTRKEVQQAAHAAGFVLKRAPFAPSTEYYEGPAGMYMIEAQSTGVPQ